LTLRLIVRPEAEADIAAGYDWYEEQREGLGREFVEEVSTTIAAVHSEPRRFPAVFRKLRSSSIASRTESSLSLARMKLSSLRPCISPEIHGAFIVGRNQTSNKCFEPTRAKPRAAQASR
jgi:hypothetical protein